MVLVFDTLFHFEVFLDYKMVPLESYAALNDIPFSNKENSSSDNDSSFFSFEFILFKIISSILSPNKKVNPIPNNTKDRIVIKNIFNIVLNLFIYRLKLLQSDLITKIKVELYKIKSFLADLFPHQIKIDISFLIYLS